MTDLFAGIESRFANKLLQSLDYPLYFHIDGDDRETAQPADVRVGSSVLGRTAPNSTDGEQMLDVTIDSYVTVLASTNGAPTVAPTEIAKDLRGLFDPSLGDESILVPGQTRPKRIVDLTKEDIAALEAEGDRTSDWGLGHLWKQIKKVLKKVADTFVRNFMAFLKKYFRFTLIWSEVRLDKLPTVVMSNPVRLNKVVMHARVRIEACIKLDRWRCADITSPWVRFEAKGIDLEFSAKDLVVFGQPSVRGLDFVIKISLFGYTFNIDIGITGMVNKELKKKGPQEIVDLTGFEFAFATLGRKFVAEQIGFSATSTWIEADLTGKVTPL